MNRLSLAGVGILLCATAVAAWGQDQIPQPRPLDQLSLAQREKYAQLLQEYKGAVAKRDRILQGKRKTDAAFERAEYWLDNLRLKGNTQFRRLEKDYLSANMARQSDYRRWTGEYASSVRNETLDKEWNDVPDARPALLFVMEKMLEMALAGDTEKAGPDLAGKDEEKWNQLWAFLLNRVDSFIIDKDVDKLEQELQIPGELKDELYKQAVDSSLFLVYDTYFRLHLPPELASLRKEIIASVNGLNELRPGWKIAEGIESPADPRRDENGSVSQSCPFTPAEITQNSPQNTV